MTKERLIKVIKAEIDRLHTMFDTNFNKGQLHAYKYCLEYAESMSINHPFETRLNEQDRETINHLYYKIDLLKDRIDYIYDKQRVGTQTKPSPPDSRTINQSKRPNTISDLKTFNEDDVNDLDSVNKRISDLEGSFDVVMNHIQKLNKKINNQ